MSGDTALVGAHEIDGGNHLYRGAAFVFVRVGQAVIEHAKLAVDDGSIGSWFGASVALSGDTALVGEDSRVGRCYPGRLLSVESPLTHTAR